MERQAVAGSRFVGGSSRCTPAARPIGGSWWEGPPELCFAPRGGRWLVRAKDGAGGSPGPQAVAPGRPRPPGSSPLLGCANAREA